MIYIGILLFMTEHFLVSYLNIYRQFKSMAQYKVSWFFPVDDTVLNFVTELCLYLAILVTVVGVTLLLSEYYKDKMSRRQ